MLLHMEQFLPDQADQRNLELGPAAQQQPDIDAQLAEGAIAPADQCCTKHHKRNAEWQGKPEHQDAQDHKDPANNAPQPLEQRHSGAAGWFGWWRWWRVTPLEQPEQRSKDQKADEC